MLENFLNQSINLNFDINVLYNLLISILCGLAIRFTLPLCNQNWVQTLQHTLSYAMLPPITFIITKVISGNIALSLGMVGALSIVRFRTPVRSFRVGYFLRNYNWYIWGSKNKVKFFNTCDYRNINFD